MQAIDPSLGVRFVPLPSGAQWGITQRWAQTDKRRLMIQLGQMDPDCDYDIIAWVPVRLPLDEVPGWVARQWKPMDKEDLKRFLDRLTVDDLEQTKEASREATEEAMNVVEVMGSRLFEGIVDPVPKVLSAGIPSTPSASTSEKAPTISDKKKGKKKP